MTGGQVEEKVSLDALKAGIPLEPGHEVILIIDGVDAGGPPPAPQPEPSPAAPPQPDPAAPTGDAKQPAPVNRPGTTPTPAPAAKKYPAPYDKWQEFIEAAAHKFALPPAFVVALVSRESNGENVIGDYGHGHGLLQIDDRFHEPWLKKHKQGMDPRSNLEFGCSLLRAYLDIAEHKHKLAGEDALRFAAAAFNAGVHGAEQGLAAGDCDRFTTHRDFGKDVLKRMHDFEQHIEPKPHGPGQPPPAKPPPPGHHLGHGHPGGEPHPAHPDRPADGNENARAYAFGKHVEGKWIHDLKKQEPWVHYLDDVPDSVCGANFVSACFQMAGLITRRLHDDNVNALAKRLHDHPHWETVALQHARQGDFVRLVTGPGPNDRHAVMYSHSENGKHFFLGANNVDALPGKPQKISILPMAWTVESVHHFKGHAAPVPAHHPTPETKHPHHEGTPDLRHLSPIYRKLAPLIEEFAAKYDLPPAFIAAVIDRETGGVNEIGDYGHGHGVMQIDDRSHAAWLQAHDDGMNEKSNIDYGCSMLRANLDAAFHAHKLKGGAALKFAASAYNAGLLGAERGLALGDSDIFTTHHDYGADVLHRMGGFERGFGLRPARPGTGGQHPAGGHPGHHPGHEPGHQPGSRPPRPPPQHPSAEVGRAYAIGKTVLGRTIESLKHDAAWRHYLDTGVDDGECCANFVSACYQKAGLMTAAMHSDSVLTLLDNLKRSGHWHPISIHHAVPGDYVALETGSQHAVMFSHAEGAQHFFLGSNNISGSMQKISIEEMGYPIIEVLHYTPPPQPKPPPEHHPKDGKHALVDVTLLDANHKGEKLARAHVQVTAQGKTVAAQTDANGRLVLHLEGKNEGSYQLVVQSQGADTGGKPPPPPPPHKPPPPPKKHGHEPPTTPTPLDVNARELRQIMPDATQADIDLYVRPLNKAMREFEINSPRRQAAFLAQLATESGSLVYKEEIADGSAYEGRVDLGNTHPGDGRRYKGRGLIQVTGRSNYESVGRALGVDLIDHPDWLMQPVLSCRASAYFFYSNGLNQLADAGDFNDICLRVNGGWNLYSERVAFWDRAKAVLGNSDRKRS